MGKTDNTGSYSYLCDGASPGSPVLWDGHATYTPGLSENRGGTSSYAASDVLGNLWFVDNASAQQTYYQDTSAFGTPLASAGSGSVFGFGGANGCQTDSDIGLVLMGHRYYDTRIGRFITQDPAHDGMNWYRYVGNDPMNKTDPLGLYWAGGTLPGNLSPTEVEAAAVLNGADPGQTFDVTTGSGKSYSFTISGAGASSSGMGFGGLGLGIGIANEFINGTNNHNRNYGPTSTQSRNMRNSNGYQVMLLQIMKGQTSGGVSTPLAALLTSFDYLGNGTEDQLGAFAWAFTNPSNSNLGIDITNDITVNSLFYHIPSTLNNLGVPNPMAAFGGSANFATQWLSGPYGTIHQKLHLNFP